MNCRRSLCITAVTLAGFAGTVLISGPASADTVTMLDPAVTIGAGSFPCAGYVRAMYDPARKFHGRQVVWMRAELGYRVGQVRVCAANATLSWRNLDTGETGSSVQLVPLRDSRTLADSSTPSPADASWVPFDLGRRAGHYQVLIGTDLPHINGHGEIVVPR